MTPTHPVPFDDFLISLFTEDAAIEPTAGFYTRLGFAETFRTPDRGAPEHVEVRSGGLTVAISSARVAGVRFGLAVTPSARSSDLTLWVDDVDQAHAAALAAGGTDARPPAGHLDGRLRHSWILDPSGHLLGLVQKTG